MCTELLIMRRRLLRPRIDGWTVRTASPAGTEEAASRRRECFEGNRLGPKGSLQTTLPSPPSTGRRGDSFDVATNSLDNGLLIDGLKALAAAAAFPPPFRTLKRELRALRS